MVHPVTTSAQSLSVADANCGDTEIQTVQFHAAHFVALMATKMIVVQSTWASENTR